jgi:uncharacterized protein YjdB
MMLSIRPVWWTCVLVFIMTLMACSDTARVSDVDRVQVKLDRATLMLETGSSSQLIPLGSIPTGSLLTWSTSNAAVADVDQTGVVKAVETGDAVVTLSVSYNSKVDKASTSVKVTQGPAKLVLQDGGGQSGVVGSTLPSPVRVLVTDPPGRPIPNVVVTFTAGGNGKVYSTTTATTGSDGLASVPWVLGGHAGQQTLTASIQAPGNPTVVTEATALVGAATALLLVGGDAQTGAVGAVLPVPLRVRAVDSFGNAVGGVSVAWLAEFESGSIVPVAATTGGDGYASAKWQLGTRIGTQTVSATSAAGLVRFSATGERLLATQMTITGAGTLTALGAKAQLTATAKTSSGEVVATPATWASLNPGVVSVTQTGVVTARANGSARIAASLDDATDTVTVTVAQVAATVNVLPATIFLSGVGLSTQLVVSALDANGNAMAATAATWVSSAPAVATVSRGLVTAVAAGTTRVTATLDGVSGHSDATVTIEEPKVSSVTVSLAATSLTAGSSTQATAVVRDQYGNVMAGVPVTWASSNTTAATVNGSGLVTGVSKGSASIIASAGGRSGSASLTVAQPTITSVVVSPKLHTLTAIGATVKLSATAYSGTQIVTDASFSWTSSNSAIATVSPSGTVTAIMAGTAQIMAGSAGFADTATVVVNAAAPVSNVVASPENDTIRAISRTAKYSATVYDAQGAVMSGSTVKWTSLNPAIATINEDGTVTAKSIGTALLVAAATACAACSTDTVSAVVRQVPAVVQLSAANLSLQIGASQAVSAVVKDSAGYTISGAKVAWSASPTSVVTVSSSGMITAIGPGSATVTALSDGPSTKLPVTVAWPDTPPPPVAVAGEFVVYPNPQIAFIIGPQLRSGSPANPWPWFDSNAITMGLHHGQTYHDGDRQMRMYYDQVLVQYTNYYRTGDERFLKYARDLADTWYGIIEPKGTGTAPRSVALGGLMLRALDGRPEMWEWITKWSHHHLWNWIERRYGNEEMWYGARDGAYATLYAIQLSQVHPDAAVRTDLAARTTKAVTDYWKPHQDRRGDGGWYWKIEHTTVGDRPASQPFQIGIVAEALIAHHQATGNAITAQMIARCAEWLYTKSFQTHMTTNVEGLYWRSMRYFTVFPDYEHTNRTSAFNYNKQDGAIRDARQLNSTTTHVFGYAYKVTGDTKYLAYGDDVFSATFGKGSQGPGTDGYWALADYDAKSYNQSYRAGGRYLAWRAGAPQ